MDDQNSNFQIGPISEWPFRGSLNQTWLYLSILK
jgi:hypothetical protein